MEQISLQKIAEISKVLTVLTEKLTKAELLNFNKWLEIVKRRQNDIKSDYREIFDEQLKTIEGLAHERDLYSDQAKQLQIENENLSKGYDDWHNLYCKLKQEVIEKCKHEWVESPAGFTKCHTCGEYEKNN